MLEEIINLNHIGINVKYALDHKEAVLFLHFSGGNLNMWDGIIPQFEQEYSIIAPDCRGHGKSDKPETGYHIDDMANDMFLLLQHLNVKRCHIVGSSMGAEVGLSLAASHPELVQSFICEGALYNEFGEYGLFKGSEEEIKQKKEAQRARLAEGKEREFTTRAAYVEKERMEFEEHGLWNEYFSAFINNNLQQLPNGNFTECFLNRVKIEYVQKYLDVKFEHYYSKLKCPVLFLPSEEEWADEKIRSCMHAFASLVDIYEIEHIENSLHAYVWMQFPVAAAEAVKRFINKH
ncbi:alpha/beta hydrolase [Paenibacillus sp. sgz5001063]|uniref:alpha/beta hydrolase n=1 Tax=Paenibacillus sp. sgz5001063 TaxID=3242474 RepID=UPI0036D3C9BC